MKAKRKASAASVAAKRNPTSKATALSGDSSMEMEDDNKSYDNDSNNYNTNNNDNMVDVVVQGGFDNDDDADDEILKKDSVFDNQNEEQHEEEDNGNDDDDEEEEEDDDEKKGGEEEAEEEEVERPKLDEGFFEIEAIRRKRVRKGQLQYLIKWRGWPETANTWEPLENLQSCSDVIDAFEESLQSGKSSRKRKRKYGGTHSQPRKKQPRSSAGYNVTGSGHRGESNGDVSSVKTKKADENEYVNGSNQTLDEKEDNEYDPKLSELRGIASNIDVNSDNKLAITFQEDNTPEGDGPVNGNPKVDYADAVQSSRRTGAKRRKSGSVKRFKKDSVMSEPICLQGSAVFSQTSHASVGLGGATALGFENRSLAGSNSSYRSVENSVIISEIIKPIGFSASVAENAQDVLVTFVARRSDGKEVIVDNRFLKANNPLLLIDFYEQHLKYST